MRYALQESQWFRPRLLLEESFDIFAARDEACTQTTLVQHKIDTGENQAIRMRPRRLPPAKRAAAEQKLQEMAQARIIEPSSSPWSAPVVLVPK